MGGGGGGRPLRVKYEQAQKLVDQCMAELKKTLELCRANGLR